MCKIVIIEDDIDICNMIKKFLENNKYSVQYALNGIEGINLCKSFVPDLVILDIMLPGLNGDDVLQKLRKFTNAPVIVVSAKTMVQTKIELLKIGADDYMTKPFDLYALDIGRKIKAQARQAMKDGDYIGARAPYGYRKDPDNCHKLLIDENTAPVVKQIFEWAHEHVALNRIVRNLNEMGIPAPSHYKKTTGEITSPGLIGSGKWQTRTVMKILESEVYTGDLVQGKTKIVDHQQVKAGEDNLIIAKCTHEPIISHELFNAVQEYRKQICEESKATPKRPYTPNIFKGKVFCADCGRSLHRQRAERRKGPDTYWFHCLTNSRVEKDSCKGAMIQEKELISTVTAILEKELTVALGMSLPLFQLETRQKQEKDKLKIQMSAKRQEIEKTRRLIRGLYENFVQGILTNDEYFELKADYEHAINALSGEIEVFEKSMDSLDNQLARYRAMEKDAKTLAQDHVLTVELIERLIERIEIDHERNIHVTFRFKNEFQGKAVEPCATM